MKMLKGTQLLQPQMIPLKIPFILQLLVRVGTLDKTSKEGNG
jgi:hypothetical protein